MPLDPQARAVLSYPASGNPLLSGWLLGGQKLNGKAAMVARTTVTSARLSSTRAGPTRQ